MKRREFVKISATLLASQSLVGIAKESYPKNSTVKFACVGTGGRSNIDIKNFIAACEMLGLKAECVALADAFMDQALKSAKRFEIDSNRCLSGWDSYRKVAESDAEFVILATPPIFRPLHFEAMVEAGKHVMMEKPVAVDAPGCRKVIEVGNKASEKRLSVITGTQRRHELAYLKNKAKIDEGAIGEIVGGAVYWNSRVPWIKDRQPDWSDADYLAHNWLNWSEMSGDHITEQHVHNLDVANWFIGRLPRSAVGFGGRARRESGNNYDFFSVDLDYGDGVHIHSQCRQISGCYDQVGEFFRGTAGSAYGSGKIEGREVAIPERRVLSNDGSEQAMVDWITSVRAGNPLNEAKQIAESTAVAIMGRLSAYTGKIVFLRDLLSNPDSAFFHAADRILPESFEGDNVIMPPENHIPLPGDGEPIRRKPA